MFKKTKWSEEHFIWILFCAVFYAIHPLALIIYYYVKNHCKIYWLKIAAILLSIMIAFVSWLSSAGQFFCSVWFWLGLQLSEDSTGLQHPSWLTHTSGVLTGMAWRLMPSSFYLSELRCSDSWASLSFFPHSPAPLVSCFLLFSTWLLQQNFHRDSGLPKVQKQKLPDFGLRCRTSILCWLKQSQPRLTMERSKY